MNPATQTQLQQSLSLIQQGRFEEAKQVLSTIKPSTNDIHMQVCFLNGLVAQKQDRLQHAIRCYEEAVKTGPHWQAYNHLGICARKQQQYQLAAQSYQQALQYCPRSAQSEILRNLLLLLVQHEDRELLEQIRNGFHTAIEQHPVLLKLDADIDRARQNWDKAIQTYQQAIRLKPDYGFALHNLANCYLNKGDASAASKCLEQALQLQPEQAENWESMGDVYVAQGELSLAERCYHQALQRESGRVSAHVSLNELYWQSDQLDKFGWSFEQVLQQQPDNQQVRYSYIDTLISAGQDGKAMAIVEQGLERNDDWQLWHFKAKLHGRKSDNQASLAAFQRGSNESVSLAFLQDKAQMELKSGNLQEAQATLEAASQRVPDDQLTIALWGTLWRQLGDSRYHWLNDYDRFIRSYRLPVPPGYESLQTFLQELKAELLSMYRFSHAPLKQTLVNGAQLPGRLFAQQNSMVQLLVEGIQQIVESYIAELPDDDQHPLLSRKSDQFWFSGSWSVKLVPDGYHVAHVHPAGWISSSCYIHLPETMTSDNADQQGAIQFGASPLSLGHSDQPELTVMPEPGMVVLFPSYMWHRTVPFQSEDPEAFRLTTPFDVSVQGRS